MRDDLDDLRDQLASISEQLGDHIMVMLTDAVHEGATKRPPEERLVARARAAVDKAVHLLDRLDADADVDTER